LQLDNEQIGRKDLLESLLKEKKLYLRNDSDISWDYVLYGSQAQISDPYVITQRMCEAHYLHNYCNFYLGRRIAYNTNKDRGQVLPYQKWQELINRSTLLTTDLKKFPDVWPWLKGLSPDEWKKKHDLTKKLVRKTERLTSTNKRTYNSPVDGA
jgi:hypothetical protein